MGYTEDNPGTSIRLQWSGLILGPVLALATWAVLATTGTHSGVSPAGARVAGIAILMGIWWLSEAMPLAATALLPIVFFPLMGVMTVKDATAPFGDDLIFLFLGGFFLQLAMERWGLHRRVALVIILAAGTAPSRLVAGIMLATGLVSMWISNAASAAMMLPIGASLCELVAARHKPRDWTDGSPLPGVPDHPNAHVRNFGKCVMIGIAWAATIGGLATPIGTAPNVQLRGYLAAQGFQSITFAQWMLLCGPMAIGFMVLVWFLLTRVFFPVANLSARGGRADANAERSLLVEELRALGPINRGEWATMIVFACAVVGWLFGEYALKAMGIPSAGYESVVAMAAGLSLFVIPLHPKRGVFVMDWKHAARVPYGVLLLFGGGLALAAGMRATGLDKAVGGALGGLGTLHPFVLMLALVAMVVFLSEFMSNTALTVTLLPIVGSVAVALGLNPITLLLPLTLGASCAFMMPAGTPPSAITFASGYFGIRDMARPGLVVDLLGVGLISVMVYTGLELVFRWWPAAMPISTPN